MAIVHAHLIPLKPIQFGVIVGDGKNFTVEVTSLKVQQVHIHSRRRGGPHYCNRYKTCCRKHTTTHRHRLKIMSRYSYSFVKSLGIPKPGNHRNHATITLCDMDVSNKWDIKLVIAYVNVMHFQIRKDVKRSLRTKKLVKRSAKEIHELRISEYPDMKRLVYLKPWSGDEEDGSEESEEDEAPRSPTPLMTSARHRKKYNV